MEELLDLFKQIPLGALVIIAALLYLYIVAREPREVNGQLNLNRYIYRILAIMLLIYGVVKVGVGYHYLPPWVDWANLLIFTSLSSCILITHLTLKGSLFKTMPKDILFFVLQVLVAVVFLAVATVPGIRQGKLGQGEMLGLLAGSILAGFWLSSGILLFLYSQGYRWENQNKEE